MNKLIKKWSGLLGVLFILASCSPSAHIEKDDTADFTTYKTFAWAKNLEKDKKDKNNKAALAEQQLKNAVSNELEKSAGWKEVKHNPDIIITYDVLVERGIKESSDPVYSRPTTRLLYNPYTRRYVRVYYPSQFIGYSRDERSVSEGTVTISMIDTKADKMVWQGWTTDEVNNRNLTSKEINTAVRSIFKKFDTAKN